MVDAVRRIAGIVGSFLCVAVLAGPAQAVTIIGPAKFQRWADASFVPTPRGVVRVTTTEPCPPPPGWMLSPAACSYPGWIYGTSITRPVFLYELGHEFDFDHVSDGLSNGGSPLRAGYERIRGLHGAWWGTGIGDIKSPGELFARDYLYCSDELPSLLRFTTRTKRRICALIRRVG